MQSKYNYGYSTVNPAKFTFAFCSENAFLLATAIVSLIIPILWHQQAFPNQLIVGTIVNALLAGSALYLTFKKSVPVILLPAIAVLLSGAIFGGFTIFLLYLVPFIWAGNALYVYSIKALAVAGKMNYLISVLVASILKAAVIGIPTFTLVSFGAVPQILLLPMSALQFATAILGGALAGITLYFRK